MKKITLLLVVLALTLTSETLTAQTYYSTSLNGGTVYASNPGSFAGYPWGGVGNHVFSNATSKGLTLTITDYDETNPSVGEELTVLFGISGFGNAPLNWNFDADSRTDIKIITPSDFTDGTATVTFDIPAGTLPVEQTANYVAGYNYILQIAGANPSTDQTYINYVVKIEDEIIGETANTTKFNKLEASFYNSSKDAVILNNNLKGSYKIYDLTGRTLVKGEVSNEVNVSTLRSGVYFLKVDGGILKFAK